MSNKQYRLIVFDWEGTLGDTLGQVLYEVSANAKRLRLGELDENLARRSLHLGLMAMIKKAYPEATSALQEQLLQAVQQSLMLCSNDEYLFKGAKDLVQKLDKAGVNLAIATNKGQNSLQRALQLTGLDAYFKVTRSAGQTLPKPSSQMLEEILMTFALTAEEALMIGDSQSDVLMAKSIGMDVIGVNFYQQDAQMLLDAGALKVFDNYQLIAGFLDV